MSGHAPRMKFEDRIFTQSEANWTASSQYIEGIPDEQRTSPVRRTLLLMMVFDFLLCFILWVVYVQQTVDAGKTLSDAMYLEIVKYSYKSSLFDSVILSFMRFLVVEIVYGACRAKSPYYSGAVTGVVSALLVVKCFVFHFNKGVNSNPQLAYALVITPLVLTWVETSFLICRVIPQEKAASHIACSLANDERRSLLGPTAAGGAQSTRYGTTAPSLAYFTPAGSIISAYGPRSRAYPSHDAIIDIAALLDRASFAQSELWFLLESNVWDSSINLSYSPVFESCQYKKIDGYPSKVHRLETILDASVSILHSDFVYNIDDLPSWYNVVSSVERLQILQPENVDVIRSVICDLSHGTMSPRDLVLLRSWGQRDDLHFVVSLSVEHPRCPVTQDHVRAQQWINGYIFQPLETDPTRSRFIWFACTDMKMMMPNMIVDRFAGTQLQSLLQNLKQRAAILSQTRSTNSNNNGNDSTLPSTSTSVPSSMDTTGDYVLQHSASTC